MLCSPSVENLKYLSKYHVVCGEQVKTNLTHSFQSIINIFKRNVDETTSYCVLFIGSHTVF